MKCLSGYKNAEKARAYRNRQRKLNYDRGMIRVGRNHMAYTTKECKIVLEKKMKDREIAEMLQRSVRSIQGLRFRLKRRENA